jgi:putative transposase
MSSGIFNKYTGYHNRRSIRLRGYDYSRPGYYFVTICIQDRNQKLFGNVVDGKMALNQIGEAVQFYWNGLTDHFNNIRLDEFVIMPNHFHGIIVICNTVAGAGSSRPQGSSRPTAFLRAAIDGKNNHIDDKNKQGRDDRAPTLGNMVAFFKYQSTKQINAMRQSGVEKIWQRNYYDTIVKDEKTIYHIRQYIRNNPVNWSLDPQRHLENEIENIPPNDLPN